MHHLDEVAGTAFADPVAAGLAGIGMGADRLEEVSQVRPRLTVAAGHDARAVAGAFLAAGNAHADEADALLGESLDAALAVLVVRITAVDDDVAGLEVGQEVVDALIHGVAGLDHQQHAPWTLQQGHHCRCAVRALYRRAACRAGEELVHASTGTIPGDDAKALVGEVEDQVLAHYGEPDDGDVCGL
ncbi:MAG: hypothetical protein AW09_000797 [Candidatus Accumulibacter phosphatis]|uniref:Uncharacterized protein n=1 Tax=Candidatus Accumulibacter phosphatis TaxID=327160 RepID=A0A080LYJ3_9PROT|nr:MAG: hypothetical protein AW09_000797 [Candidatus Accumulibacter phosphatis]